jgi:hypothetical protein
VLFGFGIVASSFEDVEIQPSGLNRRSLRHYRRLLDDKKPAPVPEALTVSPIGATAPTETGGGHSLKKKYKLLPPRRYKDVIPPPATGDEGIYTDAPNPEAGHENEVIPPPNRPSEEPSRGKAS